MQIIVYYQTIDKIYLNTIFVLIKIIYNFAPLISHEYDSQYKP